MYLLLELSPRLPIGHALVQMDFPKAQLVMCMLNLSYGYLQLHPQDFMESLTHTPPILTISCRMLLDTSRKLCPLSKLNLEWKLEPN